MLIHSLPNSRGGSSAEAGSRGGKGLSDLPQLWKNSSQNSHFINHLIVQWHLEKQTNWLFVPHLSELLAYVTSSLITYVHMEALLYLLFRPVTEGKECPLACCHVG